MPRRFGTLRLLFAALGVTFLSLRIAVAQSPALQIKSIEISPAWARRHNATTAMVTITNDKGVFRRTWDPIKISPEYNSIQITAYYPDHPPQEPLRPTHSISLSNDTVSLDDVMALVHALRAPAMSSPSLPNLGITSAWLTDHANEAAKHFGNLGETNDQRQQEFLRESFTDLALIDRILPRVVGERWTDDPVWVHVVVRFTNGRTLSAETMNQPAFMLPWTCRADGKTTRTYNADISRAVAQLLPTGAVNKERLQGTGLMDQIVHAIRSEIELRWDEIGAEDKAGDALALLRERYSVRRSEASTINYIDFGSGWSGSEALQADVRLDSFPPNLLVGTIFPLVDGKAVGVDSFLRDGDRYERIVLDNPWIMASLRKHPDRGACLVFVKDESMSDKAMRIFAADMHALGRDDLAQEVSAHQNEVAHLIYFYDDLILFPDHHAILWRSDTSLHLFKWPASAIKTGRCSDYNTSNQGCSAVVIGPDGVLKK